jgi:hypothetical protein
MNRLTNILAAHDYIIGVWLLLMPWLVGFNEHFLPTIVSLLIGIGVIVYSMFSNERFAVVKFIPDSLHVPVDASTGLLLSVAPWLFKYHHLVIWPHLLTGFIWLFLTIIDGRQRRRREVKKII